MAAHPIGKIFLIFIFKSSLFDSRSSDRRISSGQTRKVLYATRATRGNQKDGISPRIQVKIRKNPSFKFFSDLRCSTSPVISDLYSKLLYATRATRKYRNHGISSREIVNTYEYV